MARTKMPRSWNSKKRRPKPKLCWTPKRAATRVWKLTLRYGRQQVLRATPSGHSSGRHSIPAASVDAAVDAASAAMRSSRHRSEEHTSELQSPCNLVCRLLLEKKKLVQQKRNPENSCHCHR